MADKLLPCEKLQAFVKACLVKMNVPDDDAALIADSLTAANLRGVDSHGVVRLPHYSTRLRNGTVKARPQITVERTGPCTAKVNGDAGMGQVVGTRAMAEAVALARESGIGVVTAMNSSHFGAAAYYVRQAVSAGFAAFAMTHADPIMVPFGMKRKALGSNPLAFGAPADGDFPLIIDMSSTNVALGKVIVAQQENKKIPADWGVDETGVSTTDPHKVVGLAPFAGPKGTALAILIETLCAQLAGAPFGQHIPKMYQELDRPRELGHFFLVLDIARFQDPRVFRRRLGQMLKELREEEPAPNCKRVMVAGQPEIEREAQRRKEGIPIGPGVLGELNALAKELGVEQLG